MNVAERVRRWWDKQAPFLIVKSAEGARSFPGNVTVEEYEAWRERMDKKGIRRIRRRLDA